MPVSSRAGKRILNNIAVFVANIFGFYLNMGQFVGERQEQLFTGRYPGFFGLSDKNMIEVKLRLDERKRGAFYIEEEGKQIGEMVVGVSDTALTVYHTEVDENMSGKGYAKLMLDEMVGYARKQNLQVVPLCEYVHVQFKKHPDEFQDVWRK
jgi:predicted GNAT family acetyltransferase